MIGQRFGRLVCVQIECAQKASFRCDCGTTFTAWRSNVRTGRTRSCGCLKAAVNAERGARTAPHGHAARESREYRTWVGMIQRCTNPKASNWRYYGGRGIAVCERWRNSFALFLDDVGLRPLGTTLDRINPNGNYELGNVRWATPREQRANRCR